MIQHQLWLTIQAHRLRAEALTRKGRADLARSSLGHAARCLRVLLALAARRSARGRRA